MSEQSVQKNLRFWGPLVALCVVAVLVLSTKAGAQEECGYEGSCSPSTPVPVTGPGPVPPTVTQPEVLVPAPTITQLPTQATQQDVYASSQGLPVTGGDVVGLIVIGLVLTAVGYALVITRPGDKR